MNHKNDIATVLESYLIPANEGLGMDLLKAAGKGIGHFVAAFGIFFGLTAILAGSLAISADIRDKRIANRLANPTPEEKESYNNYTHTWLPEIKKFMDECKKDYVAYTKKQKHNDLINFTGGTSNVNKSILYGTRIVSLNHSSKVFFNEVDNEYSETPVSEEAAEGAILALKAFKPIIDKWKQRVNKSFKPYFDLCIEYEDTDKDYPYVWVSLICKHVDKDGILKPGLPPFGK